MIQTLGVLLAQSRRALTKILRLDTDLTTVRAAKIDAIDIGSFGTLLDTNVASRLAAIASPSGDIPTDVQTGLTNQGFTTSRATKLDTLDTVSAARGYKVLPFSVPFLGSTTTTAFTITPQSGGRVKTLLIALSSSIGVGAIPTHVIIDGTSYTTITGMSGAGGNNFLYLTFTTASLATGNPFDTVLTTPPYTGVGWLDIPFKTSFSVTVTNPTVNVVTLQGTLTYESA